MNRNELVALGLIGLLVGIMFLVGAVGSAWSAQWAWKYWTGVAVFSVAAIGSLLLAGGCAGKVIERKER